MIDASYNDEELERDYQEHMKQKKSAPLSTSSMAGKDKDNPFLAIEVALRQAKSKLGALQGSSEQIEQMTDNEIKKKFLKNENKQLR